MVTYWFQIKLLSAQQNDSKVKMKVKTEKNSAKTRQKLIDAIGKTLAKKGFAKVGVNAVAEEAGVDKVLIYRYFGGLNGLMESYAESGDFWPQVDELLGTGAEREQLLQLPFAKIYNEVLKRFVTAIRNRPLTLEILVWEMVERNELTIKLESVREEMAFELFSYVNLPSQNNEDIQAISALFSSATNYLACRARKIKTFSGIDLTTDEGWDRLLLASERLTTALFEQKTG